MAARKLFDDQLLMSSPKENAHTKLHTQTHLIHLNAVLQYRVNGNNTVSGVTI